MDGLQSYREIMEKKAYKCGMTGYFKENSIKRNTETEQPRMLAATRCSGLQEWRTINTINSSRSPQKPFTTGVPVNSWGGVV